MIWDIFDFDDKAAGGSNVRGFFIVAGS